MGDQGCGQGLVGKAGCRGRAVGRAAVGGAGLRGALYAFVVLRRREGRVDGGHLDSGEGPQLSGLCEGECKALSGYTAHRAGHPPIGEQQLGQRAAQS
ncbi:hypothetical protein NDU88_007241 [Pleurodeles waltl]|uniref:Uncharacterized protein n=1 Tax=Pleurodeles waltl TaxID=8319 RepID=A0AAV7QME2_PLEWA|nr:hypothetical protein NDU88_007241 [Pleurodeles waltl]